jgi:hypothetical protein
VRDKIPKHMKRLKFATLTLFDVKILKFGKLRQIRSRIDIANAAFCSVSREVLIRAVFLDKFSGTAHFQDTTSLNPIQLVNKAGTGSPGSERLTFIPKNPKNSCIQSWTDIALNSIRWSPTVVIIPIAPRP